MSKKKILLIDDEEDLIFAVRMHLEANGYEVNVAMDGQEGLDKARQTNPDIIILDLMLPKMDGYKVCRMLKFDEKYKKTPVIMVTARSQKEDKSTGEEVGADAYITKPFESDDLLGTIEKLLN